MIDVIDLIPEERRSDFDQAFEKQDQLESLQLLSDLRYLPLKVFDNQFVSEDKFKGAIDKFRSEYEVAKEDRESSNFHEIYNESLALDHEDSEKLSERDIFLLKSLTGLESELIISSVPVTSQVSLLSRVIIYRFRIYDLIKNFSPAASLTKENLNKIKSVVTNFEFQDSWIDFANMLANQQELSDFCINSSRLNKLMFDTTIFFSIKSKNGKQFVKEFGSDVKNLSFFLRVLPEGKSKSSIKSLLSYPDKEEVSQDLITKIQVSENQFLLRVLQVKLWILGLYDGRLDHDFGPLTFKALNEYLLFLEDKPGFNRRELSKILYVLESNQCALNFEYLLIKHINPIEGIRIKEKHSSVSQVYDFVLEEKNDIKSIKKSEKMKIEKGRKNLNKQLEHQLVEQAKSIVDGQRQRRQYKGRKGILKIFSKLFNLARKVVKTIIKLIKKLIDIIKKSIKIIFNEIKEAIQAFGRGLSFLFGKRIVSKHHSIKTDFDFDFDGITTLTSQPTEEKIKAHITAMKEKASAIYPTLKFIKIVIQWGIRLGAGPIGWIQIIIGIAKLFKDYLLTKLKKKKANMAIMN